LSWLKNLLEGNTRQRSSIRQETQSGAALNKRGAPRPLVCRGHLKDSRWECSLEGQSSRLHLEPLSLPLLCTKHRNLHFK
jgi:hypothetical protein